MDTGDMLLTRALTLARDETAATLHDRLTALGGAAAVAALDGLAAGTLTRTPQPAAGVSYAPKISKSDAELDWSRAAAALAQQVRAYAPWPGTRTTWEGQVLKIHPPVAVLPGHPSDVVAPGTVVAAGPAGIDVATGRGLLRVMRLQLPNKKALDVDAFVAGRGVRAGMRFGPPTSEGG